MLIKGELPDVGYLVYMRNMVPGGAEVCDFLFDGFKMRLESAAPVAVAGRSGGAGLIKACIFDKVEKVGILGVAIGVRRLVKG